MASRQFSRLIPGPGFGRSRRTRSRRPSPWLWMSKTSPGLAAGRTTRCFASTVEIAMGELSHQIQARTTSRVTWQRNGKEWWSRRDSNPRPPRCERGALPAELLPHGREDAYCTRPASARQPAGYQGTLWPERGSTGRGQPSSMRAASRALRAGSSPWFRKIRSGTPGRARHQRSSSSRSAWAERPSS